LAKNDHCLPFCVNLCRYIIIDIMGVRSLTEIKNIKTLGSGSSGDVVRLIPSGYHLSYKEGITDHVVVNNFVTTCEYNNTNINNNEINVLPNDIVIKVFRADTTIKSVLLERGNCTKIIQAFHEYYGVRTRKEIEKTTCLLYVDKGKCYPLAYPKKNGEFFIPVLPFARCEPIDFDVLFGSVDALRSCINSCLKVCMCLHAKGLCHGDLKLDNVFVKDGSYVVGDFGWLQEWNQTLRSTWLAGSPGFMSPCMPLPPMENRIAAEKQRMRLWSSELSFYLGNISDPNNNYNAAKTNILIKDKFRLADFHSLGMSILFNLGKRERNNKNTSLWQLAVQLLTVDTNATASSLLMSLSGQTYYYQDGYIGTMKDITVPHQVRQTPTNVIQYTTPHILENCIREHMDQIKEVDQRIYENDSFWQNDTTWNVDQVNAEFNKMFHIGKNNAYEKKDSNVYVGPNGVVTVGAGAGPSLKWTSIGKRVVCKDGKYRVAYVNMCDKRKEVHVRRIYKDPNTNKRTLTYVKC
jgi:serine/threonine protein kinase